MIGIASPAFCFSPFEEVLENISKHFGLWEVLVEGDHRLDLAREAMLEAMESFDMRFQIHAPMSDVNVGSVYEPMRTIAVKEIVTMIEVCHDMGIHLVTLHPGFVTGIAFLNKGMVVRQTKRSLAQLAPVAAEHSVELTVENMPCGINATCTTAEELVDVANEAGLKICFDMGHANTAGQVDELLKHASLFRNVHLHNNDGSWDQHNAIDDGTADVEAVVSSIIRSGYEGNYIIEATDLASGLLSKEALGRLLESPSASEAL